jgi:hypothetical protein
MRLRVDANAFVISGSGIKLTKAMQEDPLLVLELAKLKNAAKFLKNQGIIDEDDFDYYDFER